MGFSLVIAGSRTVHPSVTEVDAAVMLLPWDRLGLPAPRDAEEINRSITLVVDGGAPGGDHAGRLWAETRAIQVRDEPITEEDIRRWGKYLGPRMRNRRMAEIGDAAVVFWDGKSNGSTDFVARMVLRRKHVEIVPTKMAAKRPTRRYPSANPSLPDGHSWSCAPDSP